MLEECHICGQPAATEALVENARVFLCNRCSRFGKPVWREEQPLQAGKIGTIQQQKSASPYFQKSARPHIDFIAVEGYGRLIKKSREALHLSRKQLANTLFISENVIERLEDEALKPERRVAEKLEQFLKIKIIREDVKSKAESPADEAEKTPHESGSPGGLTLADVLDVKVTGKK